jgi:hypothetical protein
MPATSRTGRAPMPTSATHLLVMRNLRDVRKGTIASSEVARSIPMTRFKITDGTLLFMDRACSNARFHHARVHNSEPQRAHRATSEQTRRADSITV